MKIIKVQKANFESMTRETIKRVVYLEGDDDKLVFVTNSGIYTMFHNTNCCESVKLTDFDLEELENLVGESLIMSSCETQYEETDDYSKLYTFYKLGNTKGYSTIRWTGTTDSCYSISVTFIKIEITYTTKPNPEDYYKNLSEDYLNKLLDAFTGGLDEDYDIGAKYYDESYIFI